MQEIKTNFSQRISFAVRMFLFYGGSPVLLIKRILRVWRREGLIGVKRRMNIFFGGFISKADVYHYNKGDLYGVLPEMDFGFSPKVSVIVPNYNHAPYLRQRLESIYNQTYKNIEVILLDDCSGDGSVEIIKEFAQRFPDRTICHFNEENSGGVFHQWKKGLEMASGELVWIAESDDACSENFLTELVHFFSNSAVMLAFARTEFIQGEKNETIWTQEEYLMDVCPGIWKSPFIKSAAELVRTAWVAKNIIPNVSAALFRKPGNLKLLDDPQWQRLRLCGDWILYLHLIRGGVVGYSPAATNYYRQHSANTSVQAQATHAYYQEHEVVGRYMAQLYPLNSSEWALQERVLYNHWCIHQGDDKRETFLELYSQQRIQAFLSQKGRKPHVAIAVFAFSTGGGETFPINLANYLWQRGFAVTLINFQGAATEEGIRGMLFPSIALLDLHCLERVGMILDDLGVELVHSHHAWVDVSLVTFLTPYSAIAHVVTMHGMYEMMEKAQLNELLPRLKQEVDAFVYTAEKNIATLPEDFLREKSFTRIDNALPAIPVGNVKRADLGLAEEDFVLCMVARAIPEKGWEEAIASVVEANRHSARQIHLLLIGKGEEEERLRKRGQPNFVHFLGFKANVRDYFALADMGFLPTRFPGESAPLVLIDCLLSGRPMLATAIGEIPYMLNSAKGMAGVVLGLEDGVIPVEKLGRKIALLANDLHEYRVLMNCVADAAGKFDICLMVDKYAALYTQVLEDKRNKLELSKERNGKANIT